MTKPRYAIRYSGKEGFEERYQVFDMETGIAASAPALRDEAERCARNLNAAIPVPEDAPIHGWLVGLSFQNNIFAALEALRPRPVPPSLVREISDLISRSGGDAEPKPHG